MSSMQELSDAVEAGQRKKAVALLETVLEEGNSPISVLEQALIPAMGIVGQKFSDGEYFVPEMLMAAKAMKACMDELRPRLAKTDFEPIGTVVLGTVRGDLHDIGKNLVKVMLEGGGFEVVDLGVDVPPEKFVEAVREHKPQVVGLSALLTTTMLAIPDTLQALNEAGLRDNVKVIIGGAAITDDFAQEVHADAYGADAHSAVQHAKRLVAPRAAATA